MRLLQRRERHGAEARMAGLHRTECRARADLVIEQRIVQIEQNRLDHVSAHARRGGSKSARVRTWPGWIVRVGELRAPRRL
jgi:hypothetical protein